LYPEPIAYRCINCGVCCDRLLIDRQGIRKGLPLLLEETEIFPKKLVRPAYGLGKSPMDSGFKVIAYQMRLMSCPHRRLGGCIMHAYRPAICRSYPFVPIITQGRRIVKTLDMTCTALKDYLGKYPEDSVPVLTSSVETEAEYYPKIAHITEQLLEDVDESWCYNLKTGKWVPFRQMLE
jgi:Fe-S-cluster containining protein